MPLIPAMLAPYRKLRHERPGEQPAQRSAAAGQEPGGGHGGRHPQHHPWDRHWQLGKRPLAHPGTGHREAGRHQQDQVKQYCLFVTLIMWSWRNATLFTLSHKDCVIKLWNKHSLEYVINPGQNSRAELCCYKCCCSSTKGAAIRRLLMLHSCGRGRLTQTSDKESTRLTDETYLTQQTVWPCAHWRWADILVMMHNRRKHFVYVVHKWHYASFSPFATNCLIIQTSRQTNHPYGLS